MDPNFEFDKTISKEEWDIIDELRKKGTGRNTKEKREKFDGRLQEYLDSLSPSESYASVLRMALKKNIASDILRSFLSFKNKSAKQGQYPSPPDSVADEAFRSFLKHKALSLACKAFQLETFGDRYDKELEQLATEGSYTASCQAATILKRFHFPIETFCLPLLRQGDMRSMENYLENSPEHQVKLVLHLDGLQDARSNNYKLTKKKLKDMIRRYVKKWNIPESAYPLTLKHQDKNTIIHWVVKKFYNMKRENWREIVIRGVGDNKEYQEFLVTQISTEDIDEGKYLAKTFNIGESTLRKRRRSRPRGTFPVAKGSADVDYYLLPLAEEKIKLVENKKDFEHFLSRVDVFSVDTDHHLGLDVEYFRFFDHQEVQMSLIQISLEEEIFLLDFENLRQELSPGDWLSMREKVLLNEKLLIVGFSVVDDMRLLSKTIPGCEDLLEVGENLLDLERDGKSLTKLVGVDITENGLTGLCLSVLGKRLDKTEQIGDWLRRPLRPSQITYAALDAYSCWKIFQVLKNKACDLNLLKSFMKVVSRSVKMYKKNLKKMKNMKNKKINKKGKLS